MTFSTPSFQSYTCLHTFQLTWFLCNPLSSFFDWLAFLFFKNMLISSYCDAFGYDKHAFCIHLAFLRPACLTLKNVLIYEIQEISHFWPYGSKFKSILMSSLPSFRCALALLADSCFYCHSGTFLSYVPWILCRFYVHSFYPSRFTP